MTTRNIIDIRSDTVTVPTAEMREAMANAPVGDDVYGEDPTVNKLQELAAEMTGKEAALFVASGTQGNQISLAAHCGRGEEAIVGFDSHIFNWEAGGAAVNSAISLLPLQTDDRGRLNIDEVRSYIRPDDAHVPKSRLVCAENSSGGNHGAALDLDYFKALRQVADEHGLAVHLDGARVFNAVTTLGIEIAELAQYVDTISICLSKGLGAPVGSVIVGSKDFIYDSHRIRKVLGGGMRQAGILAAAGIISLETMSKRLVEDHVRAKAMAEGLSAIPEIDVDLDRVETNMIFFGLQDGVKKSVPDILEELKVDHDIRLGAYPGRDFFRAVTHCWVDDEAVERVPAAFKAILS